ncbi:helix-turn-helix domain-containing protein [Terrilactibacillus laevilacticus]|uniref:Helix-turn-helix domain-containing protein n=1 Tax=Terrilactibacillus laevilacticus TaxID=1380157 RepID=A0ABW5PV03_9BACI|nr:helix-turn-helix domain-containing protein [Terrilactibacillus laevilacticus]
MTATIDREQETLWDTVKFLAKQQDIDKAEAVLKATIEKSLQLLNLYTPIVSHLRFSIPAEQFLNELKHLDADIRKKISRDITEKTYEEILDYIKMISEMTEDPQVTNKKMLASILFKKAKQDARVRRKTPTQFPEVQIEIDEAVKEGEKPFYTTSEAGHKLGLSDQTIRRMCESGKFIGAYRSEGGHWRIPEENFITTREQDIKGNGILEHLDKKNQEEGDVDEFDL